MGGILSIFWDEEEDNYLGLTAEEAKEQHSKIKREYGHPKWGSVLRKRKDDSNKMDSKNSAETSVNGRELEDNEDNKGVVVVGVDGAEIDKELLKKVIQNWESLDSDHGGSIEEEDNVRNILDELQAHEVDTTDEIEVSNGANTLDDLHEHEADATTENEVSNIPDTLDELHGHEIITEAGINVCNVTENDQAADLETLEEVNKNTLCY